MAPAETKGKGRRRKSTDMITKAKTRRRRNTIPTKNVKREETDETDETEMITARSTIGTTPSILEKNMPEVSREISMRTYVCLPLLFSPVQV